MVYDPLLPAQRELVDSVLSKPGTNIEEEMSKRNRAIRAVMLYCSIEEGGMNSSRKEQRSRSTKSSIKSQLEYEKDALEVAKVSVYKKNRPKVCFVCLGNGELPTAERTYL